MKPGELIDVCIECYKTYTPSKVTLDSHLEVFLAKIDATDEGDVVFIKQVVYGCIRFKKLNKVTLTALYFKHGTQVTCPRRASPRPPLPHSPHYRGFLGGRPAADSRRASGSNRRWREHTGPVGRPRLDFAGESHVHKRTASEGRVHRSREAAAGAWQEPSRLLVAGM